MCRSVLHGMLMVLPYAISMFGAEHLWGAMNWMAGAHAAAAPVAFLAAARRISNPLVCGLLGRGGRKPRPRVALRSCAAPLTLARFLPMGHLAQDERLVAADLLASLQIGANTDAPTD